MTGLLINVALAITKLLAGLLGNSYALIADAVESMADIFGSFVVWGGLRISALPRDETHPYGHGKAEPIAAFIVSLMLFGAGVGIAIEAIQEVIKPHHAPKPFTLAVLIGVVLVKEGLFRFVHGVAQEGGSGAVMADAWHHRSDAITSAAAFIGISIALIGGPGYEAADDWAAMFASGVILFNAWRLIQSPLHELMDREPTELVSYVRTLAAKVTGVQGVEKVFARKVGTHYWVDMHVEVDPEMSVLHAHAIAHEVKERIREAVPAVIEVLIHVEPFGYPHSKL